MPAMPLFNTFRRLLPPYGFKREEQIAAKVGSELQILLLMHTRHLGFEFKAVPANHEADALLGFVSAAADVLSQAHGGKPGGHGSVNATLRVLQALLLEGDVQPMIERTLALHSAPTAPFVSGHQAGGAFVNADLSGNLDESIQVALAFFSKHYGAYCSSPRRPQ